MAAAADALDRRLDTHHKEWLRVKRQKLHSLSQELEGLASSWATRQAFKGFDNALVVHTSGMSDKEVEHKMKCVSSLHARIKKQLEYFYRI